ncbi:unnamed protein product [Pleuronectes platessa]|uniref:Uncharacterized protein n=1 Tax=Pleuronectes platessa TaxID=8262 RepID=A0A9N7Z536_PLEPL|nr:unnamed protein product [Pleuronectes platessa]
MDREKEDNEEGKSQGGGRAKEREKRQNDREGNNHRQRMRSAQEALTLERILPEALLCLLFLGPNPPLVAAPRSSDTGHHKSSISPAPPSSLHPLSLQPPTSQPHCSPSLHSGHQQQTRTD